MRNRYILLKWRLFWNAVFERKVTFRKLWNVFRCSLSFLLRSSRSGAFPFVLSIETGNECNANCLFCRDAKGVIHDINPAAVASGSIPKGTMPIEMALDIVKQAKDDALIAVLYTNGEPLLYKEFPRLARACADNRLLAMIATNGLLLNERWADALLDSGIDFIKLQLSGFTQATYSVQVRYGDVEKLKENIRVLAKKRDAKRSNTLLMLDYISYSYNRHEIPLVQDFCRELGIMLNVRPGNPKGGLEGKEAVQSDEALPLKVSCDWVWKGMQINFNGDVFMCCDGVIFSGLKPYTRYEVGKSRIRDIWNSAPAQAVRRTLIQRGRGAIPLCAQCYRKSVAFKW